MCRLRPHFVFEVLIEQRENWLSLLIGIHCFISFKLFTLARVPLKIYLIDFSRKPKLN